MFQILYIFYVNVIWFIKYTQTRWGISLFQSELKYEHFDLYVLLTHLPRAGHMKQRSVEKLSEGAPPSSIYNL